MNTKVCKFGGTSMANSDNINAIANIIESDKERRFVIVSAPGKRNSNRSEERRVGKECM